ncbi:MAG: hypothetical protein HYU66_16950 [Armatimonadetes bacterium]|nr:hypothetical protein [Armatimonadota bacterium]
MSVVLVVDPPLVLLSADEALARLAARELIRCTVAAGGEPLTAVTVLPGIEAKPAAAGRLRLAAGTAAGLLQAVYRHLETQGWRWFFPGPLGQVCRPDAPPPRGAAAPFRARLAVDRNVADAGWQDEMIQLVRWLARQGFTALAAEGGPAPEDAARVAEEAGAYALGLEVGGDWVGRLLGAARSEQPEPVRHRLVHRREPRLEAADAEALAGLPRAAAELLERYPGASALRLLEPADAPLDLGAAGTATPGQRLQSVVERCRAGLDEPAELAAWQPGSRARSDYAPPEGVRPVVLWEPGARRRVPAGAEVVFTHADPPALWNLAGPLPRTVAADLEALRAAAVERVGILVHGALAWWACSLNLYVFARCARETGLDAGALVADWCAGLFGPAAEQMAAWYAEVEPVLLAVRPLSELARVPETGRMNAERATALLESAGAAVAEMSRLADRSAQWGDESGSALVEARLTRESQALRLTQHHAELYLVRLQSQLGYPTLAHHAAARELVTAILQILEEVPASAGGAALAREYRETLYAAAGPAGVASADNLA